MDETNINDINFDKINLTAYPLPAIVHLYYDIVVNNETIQKNFLTQLRGFKNLLPKDALIILPKTILVAGALCTFFSDKENLHKVLQDNTKSMGMITGIKL